MFKPSKFYRNKLAIGIGSALLVCVSNDVSAQTLEEVTVTAQKREQSLQDVGIAVTAMTGESIREYGFSNAIDVITKAPSLDNYSTYGPGSSANITIRGIGLNDFGEGHEAPVTAYIDEFYVVSVPAVDFALYDLERVEILRGPQGTLFGRNSTGGLLHFVTSAPTEEFGGYLTAEAASFSEKKLEGAVGGALSDTVLGRLSFLYHDSDGFIKNRNPNISDNGGQAGTKSVRAQLQFMPTDDMNILLKAEYSDIDKVHTYYEQAPLTAADPVSGLFATNSGGIDGAGYNERNFGAGDRNETFTSRPSKLEQDGLNLLLRIEKEFGDVILTSITGYLDMERSLQEDCDASANDICFATFPYETDWVTQELRLNGTTDKMRWTAGIYFLQQDASNNPAAVFNVPVSGPTAIDPATGLYNGAIFPISLAANWEQETTSISGFGQVEFDLNENLRLIAGIRLGKDEKDFVDQDNATLRSCPGFPIPSNCALPPDGPGIANPYAATYDEDLLSWKLGLDYDASENVLLFASISQGSKSGGFNNGFYSGAAAVNPGLLRYGDEKNIAYEVGVKSTLWENRLRINGSAFFYDYSDFQTFNWEGIGGLVGNSDASAAGAEVEIEAFLTEQLNVRLGVSVLDTNIENLTGRSATFTADREMANAPKTTANGSVSYDFHASDDVDVRLIWDWNYAAERYTNNFNDPTSELDAYFKHNASMVVSAGENWRFTGYVRNISDKENEIKVFVFDSLGYRQVIHAQPRTYGLSVNYEF